METFNFFMKVAFMAIIIYNVLETKWLPTTSHSLPKPTLFLLRKDVDIIPVGKLDWCEGDKSSGRVCNFRNICYSHYHDGFFLFKDNNSFSDRDVEQQFTPRRGIVNLATAIGTHIPFDYVEVSLQNAISEKYIFKNYLKGKYWMYSSFVVGNIMHTIHEDLLPFFNTMQFYQNFNDEPARTILSLRHAPEFENIVNMFSKYPVISKDDLSFEPKESLTCFEDMAVGLSRDTLWYQWGLAGEPEGPNRDSKLKLEHIKNFTGYVKNAFGISPFCGDTSYGVYFSRKMTRLILNEKYLVKSISSALDIEVKELSMEHNSIPDIIKTVSCAKFALGAHGSILIFFIFLPPPSLVLELYPFALNPNDLTFYKSLTAALPDMDIEYLAWRNTNRSNTVTYPKNHPMSGGIVHLSKEEQEKIINSSEVPPHLCCYDPEFRFRLNQDTVVDVREIIDLLRSSSVIKML